MTFSITPQNNKKEPTRPWGVKRPCQYQLRNTASAPTTRITHYPSLAQHPIPSSFLLHTPYTPPPPPPTDSTLCLPSSFLFFFLGKRWIRSHIASCFSPNHRSSGNSLSECVWFSRLPLADAVSFTCCHVDDETLWMIQGGGGVGGGDKSAYDVFPRREFPPRARRDGEHEHFVFPLMFFTLARAVFVSLFPPSTRLAVNYKVVFTTPHTQHSLHIETQITYVSSSGACLPPAARRKEARPGPAAGACQPPPRSPLRVRSTGAPVSAPPPLSVRNVGHSLSH